MKKALLAFVMILTITGSGIAEEKVSPEKKEVTKGRSEIIYDDSSKNTIIYYKEGKEIARETFDENKNSTIIVGKIPDCTVKSYYKKDIGDNKAKEYFKENGIHWCDGTEIYKELNFKNNKRNGLEKYFLPDGRISIEDNWEDGKRVSSKDAILGLEDIYKDGKLSKRTYDASNNKYIYTTTEYNYDKNGNPESEISKTFKGGKLISVAIFSGKKNVKVKEDLRKFVSDINKMSDKEKDQQVLKEYYESWSNFNVKEYYDTGELKLENYYKNGKLDGLNKWYYEDGKLWQEENYKGGKLDGLCKIYYLMNPRIKLFGGICAINTYKNDILINSKHYDASGKETMNQDYPYEAVFTSDNIEQGLFDTLTTSFYRTGNFTVLERSKMKEILKEQKFQLTGCTKTECAVEIGKILNVKYMVIGSVAKIGKEYTVNIRIVSVESSEVVIADMEKCDDEKYLIDTIKKVVENISGKKVFGDNSKQNTIAILDLETKENK